jgi:hypothetical protein
MGEELITHLGLDYYEDLEKEYEALLQVNA